MCVRRGPQFSLGKWRRMSAIFSPSVFMTSCGLGMSRCQGKRGTSKYDVCVECQFCGRMTLINVSDKMLELQGPLIIPRAQRGE